ncbi:uncharacterized mitochondrial protein AtMg00860-like [Amblyraja radiata]|uniref:uncharacterized mitochondrial protein AtMg00860-like n=1 Tax=Amblyraja radiata TaxID=386614 RepID=UPI001402D4D4|nr:uncharacterized mitochondrial protein AtMg00860-like [Amblyraja radiata]
MLVQRLRDHSLVINAAKCQFGLSSISFLGHHVTPQGATPLPGKVEVIWQFPRPLTIRGLQEFVGMVNFYHCFVPAAAQIMRPLFQCLAGKPQDLMWDAETEAAFDGAKEALANAILPQPPSPLTLQILLSEGSWSSLSTVAGSRLPI